MSSWKLKAVRTWNLYHELIPLVRPVMQNPSPILKSDFLMYKFLLKSVLYLSFFAGPVLVAQKFKDTRQDGYDDDGQDNDCEVFFNEW